jgi:hypothetical protein
MAGTLEVTEDLCWMPASWVFDNVLERIAEVLYPQDTALAELLLASRTDANGGYLDLRDVNLETLGLLVETANIAYGCLARVGVQGYASQEFYVGLLTQFHALCDMLRTAQQARTGKRQQQAQSTEEHTPATQHRNRH